MKGNEIPVMGASRTSPTARSSGDIFVWVFLSCAMLFAGLLWALQSLVTAIAPIIAVVAVIAGGLFLFAKIRKHQGEPKVAALPSGAWFADPWGVEDLRWWDGAEWTAHVRSR
jgi:hypothetical protein